MVKTDRKEDSIALLSCFSVGMFHVICLIKLQVSHSISVSSEMINKNDQ